MTTNDIMESLKMESIWRSNQPLPSALLEAIDALQALPFTSENGDCV